MSETVVVTLTLQLKPEVVDGFCASMPETLVATRAFPGYVDVKLYRNADDPGRVIMIEEWESRDAYQRYVDWRRGTGAMDGFADLLAAPPVLDSGRRGWRERTRPEYPGGETTCSSTRN